MLWIEVALLLCTAVSTVFAFLFTRTAQKTAHALRKQRGDLEVALEDIEALKLRVKKWVGRQSRERRAEDVTTYLAEPAPENHDIDPELAAMLALQNAAQPPGGRNS